MSEEYVPMTQSDGAMDPPGRPPITAVATSAPLPEPVTGPVRWMTRRQTTLGRLIDQTLDALDRIGDTVREAFVAR